VSRQRGRGSRSPPLRRANARFPVARHRIGQLAHKMFFVTALCPRLPRSAPRRIAPRGGFDPSGEYISSLGNAFDSLKDRARNLSRLLINAQVLETSRIVCRHVASRYYLFTDYWSLLTDHRLLPPVGNSRWKHRPSCRAVLRPQPAFVRVTMERQIGQPQARPCSWWCRTAGKCVPRPAAAQHLSPVPFSACPYSLITI